MGAPGGFGPDGAQVGVVVPVYDKAAFVAETLRSVLAQTAEGIHLVVVDDGSKDGSLDVVREETAGTGATVVALANGGVSRARNIGAAAVAGGAEYLLFLDADDVLEPGAVATMVAYLDAHPRVSACYCTARLVDEHGGDLGPDPDRVRWERRGRFRRAPVQDDDPVTTLDALWSRFRMIPSSCLVRRSAFDVTAGWDDDLCAPRRRFHAEDKDMGIKLALAGEVHRIPGHLVRYRILPTPHRDSLYEGLRVLNETWWTRPLPPHQRALVRDAMRFEASVRVCDAAVVVRASARDRDARAAALGARELLRAAGARATLRWRLGRR